MGLFEVLERGAVEHPLLFPAPQLFFIVVLICWWMADDLRRAGDRPPASKRRPSTRHELRAFTSDVGDLTAARALWRCPPVLPHRESVLTNPAFAAHLAAVTAADPRCVAYVAIGTARVGR